MISILLQYITLFRISEYGKTTYNLEKNGLQNDKTHMLYKRNPHHNLYSSGFALCRNYASSVSATEPWGFSQAWVIRLVLIYSPHHKKGGMICYAELCLRSSRTMCKGDLRNNSISLKPYLNNMYDFVKILYKYGLVMRAIVQNICPREFG